MGQTTLACTKMAWTRASAPTTTYRSGDYADNIGPDIGNAYLQFADVPAALIYKPVTRFDLYLYAVAPTNAASGVVYPCYATVYTLDEVWDESTVSWYSAPSDSLSGNTNTSGQAASAWLIASLGGILTGKKVLQYGLRINSRSLQTGYDGAVRVATRYNSSASLRPYVVMIYDDTNVHLIPTPLEKSGYVNPRTTQIFSWTNAASGSTSISKPTQTAATFYYKLPSETAWQSLSMTGSTSRISVPANTLPIADSVQWKISVTDSGGTTTESEVSTVLTKDGPFVAAPSYPANGAKINETVAVPFSWTNAKPYATNQTRADLQWSHNGTTWTDLGTVSGSGTTYSVPANTFPGETETLYWRVRSYNSDGDAGEWSAAAEFSTIAEILTATPVRPINEIKNSNNNVFFAWNLTGAGYNYGTTELQISPDGTTWTTLAQPSVPNYTAEPGELVAGTVYWRVRGINRQGVAGEWSAAVSFILYGPPPAPIVGADAVPFATIFWQSTGQQAYRITVDDSVVVTAFGSNVTSYQLQAPLADGLHSATVEIQGSYGFWSDPGSIEFEVQNVPGDAVNLSGSFDVDGVLSWQTESTETPFLIYRDGVQIGRTNGFSFTDRFVLGSHSYYVINLLPGGYYTRSNTVQGAMRSCVNRIALASGGAWLELRLSENSDSLQSFSWSQTSSLRHIAGADFPVLEQSNFKTLVASYDTAFTTVQAATAFEALRGQVVILKSRGGNVVIGALTKLQKLNGDFYIVYTFELQQIHWEDFVDDTDA